MGLLFALCFFLSSTLWAIEGHLGSRFRAHGKVPEHRFLQSLPHEEAPNSASSGFNLNLIDFNFYLEAYEDNNTRIDILLNLPLRSLSPEDQESQVPQGSEFGGYTIDLRSELPPFWEHSIAFADKRSSRLHLFAANYQLRSELLIKSKPTALLPGLILQSKAGPMVEKKFSQSNFDYGFLWGARAEIGSTLELQELGRFRLNFLSAFRRIRIPNAFALDSANGATLFTLSPRLSYEVIPQLWMGLELIAALARPQGQEQLLGDADLVGLYGSSFAFTLEAHSF